MGYLFHSTLLEGAASARGFVEKKEEQFQKPLQRLPIDSSRTTDEHRRIICVWGSDFFSFI